MTRHVVMGSRLRWDAALYHRPGLQPPDKRGRKPAKGQCQRRLQGWAERADTPRVPPVEIRFGLVADPEGKLRMEAFFCTDPQTTPVQILAWVVMRGSVEVTCEEARAHLGLETQRQWSDLAMARTHPRLAGGLFVGDRAGPAGEPGRSNPGAGDGVVSQN